jgi:hypothetical protein
MSNEKVGSKKQCDTTKALKEDLGLEEQSPVKLARSILNCSVLCHIIQVLDSP